MRCARSALMQPNKIIDGTIVSAAKRKAYALAAPSTVAQSIHFRRLQPARMPSAIARIWPIGGVEGGNL